MITARRSIRHLRRAAKPVTSGRIRTPQRTAVLAAELRGALMATLGAGRAGSGPTSQRLLQAKLMMVLQRVHSREGLTLPPTGPHAQMRAAIEARRLRDALQLAMRGGHIPMSPALLALQHAIEDLAKP
ncbi:hypothetical protein DSM104443_03987 [Usitatibacter rugosus]|uniref:Uncharacterized protein n=1 Tax=Usitatibacter rugosus TaxID=2732067 RepID=A0A6M4H2F6_9PROT|nr:hypothetical protein [Usitatibacter rugosus]QJR12893.1 hypothetical protein DSM104443_03987 [Usitatibacter rugosus]